MIDSIGDRVMLPQNNGDLQKKKVITFLAVTCNATRDQR